MREETMSGREHVSEDVLLDAVYGIAGEDAEAHVRACPACAGRLSEWRQRRAGAAGAVRGAREAQGAARRRKNTRAETPLRPTAAEGAGQRARAREVAAAPA